MDDLFKLIHSKGEGVFDKTHIVLHEVNDDKIEYRVYHAKGFCFDISRWNSSEHTEIDYDFYNEFEGFKRGTFEEMYELIKKDLKWK